MKCPYCGEEMKKGILSGDGRSKVRWISDEEQVGVFDKLAGKGMVDAKYTPTKFEIESCYCSRCHKMIFDADVVK